MRNMTTTMRKKKKKCQMIILLRRVPTWRRLRIRTSE